jgi:hypothetical protein
VQVARLLLDEIRRGGCVDRGWEWLVTTLLVLGGEDVGRVMLGGPFDAFLYAHFFLFPLVVLCRSLPLSITAASSTSATSKLSSARPSKSSPSSLPYRQRRQRRTTVTLRWVRKRRRKLRRRRRTSSAASEPGLRTPPSGRVRREEPAEMASCFRLDALCLFFSSLHDFCCNI